MSWEKILTEESPAAVSYQGGLSNVEAEFTVYLPEQFGSLWFARQFIQKMEEELAGRGATLLKTGDLGRRFRGAYDVV